MKKILLLLVCCFAWTISIQAQTLYGTTQAGGSHDGGVVFSFHISSSTYTKLKDFDNTNGGNPFGSLVIANDGKFYGMTYGGGSNGLGVIYSIDPSTSFYTKLKDFDWTIGANPKGDLVQASDGKLYGMTLTGGSFGRGVLFSFDPSTLTYIKLKDFDGIVNDSDGCHPRGSLIQASDGKLYGITGSGPYTKYVVLFSFDPSHSVYTKLKVFYGDLFSSNIGDLVQATDGKLYGPMNWAGSSIGNFIYSFDPSTSIFMKTDIDTSYGHSPSGLIQATDGKLYGMAEDGGANSEGVIFSFDPSTSIYTKLKDFERTIGANPFGRLMHASDGKLYGMTTWGGSKDSGVIFSFAPPSSTYTKLKDFDDRNGVYPYSTFIEVTGTLPVKLISFTGKNNGSSNLLSWKVENEQDLNYYELQRGIDGQHFTGIAQIKAAGNNSYAFNDPIATTESSTYYYRLKSVDKDGKFTYSAILTVSFRVTNNTVSISPNPVKNFLQIKTSSGEAFAAYSSTATIRIYSSAMQLLRTKKISVAVGNTISIPVEKLAAGIYYLQLVNGRENSVLKFVKE